MQDRMISHHSRSSRHTVISVHLERRCNWFPGPLAEGLARTANTLLGTDLVIFAADALPAGNSKLWFYLPRLLHAQSCLFQAHQQDQDQEYAFGKISHAEVEQRAAASAPKRVA